MNVDHGADLCTAAGLEFPGQPRRARQLDARSLEPARNVDIELDRRFAEAYEHFGGDLERPVV